MKNSTMKEIHKLTPLLVEALKRKAVVFLLHRKVRGYSCIDNPVKKRMGEAWGPRTSLSALGPKVLGRRKKKTRDMGVLGDPRDVSVSQGHSRRICHKERERKREFWVSTNS
jgi:hypothetical protein